MSEFHKPVCADCNISMFPSKNGAWLLDMCMDPPQPYKIWACDLWQCPSCDHEIAGGFSDKSIRREKNGFKKLLLHALKGRYVLNFEKLEHAIKYGNLFIPGMTALIFQKPVTGEELEGRATLVKPLDGKMPHNFQQWMVHFPGDEENYRRVININNAELGWGK